MIVEIQKSWFSLNQCKSNPNKLYVFGDNLIRVGEAGQAGIRSADNSVGLATKKLPSCGKNAYFTDHYENYMTIVEEIARVILTFKDGDYDTLVLPYAKLGTGLSKMPEKSPELFRWMNSILSEVLNIDYNYEPII